MTRAACRRSALLALLLLGVLHLGPAAAQPPAAEKFTLGVGPLSPSLVWVFWAKEHGVFRDQGLDVDLVFFSSATEAIQALVGRRLSAVIGISGPAPAHAALAGADVVWAAELLGTMPYTLMVAPEITSSAELRGKRLATNKLGSSVDFSIRFALTRMGLDPRRDVSIVQAGDQSTRLAAMVSRSVDGTVISAPSTVVARKLGFRVLADLVGLGLKYPHESLVVDRGLIRDRPDTLRGLLRAAVRGVHHFKTDRRSGTALLRKHLKVDDDEAVDEAYEVFSRLLQRKPYLAREAVEFVLSEITATQPRARDAKPDDLMDMRFVRELDESGFIDRLYR